jgi:DNA-binding NarL/FixJ family response regulator
MLAMGFQSSRSKSDADASKPTQVSNYESHQAPVRLCLIHERLLFRETLGRLLASEPGFELVAECDTPAGALERLNGLAVDVVLLDLTGEDAPAFVYAARKMGYEGKFLVVTSNVDAAGSALALKLGVSGIFLESKPSAQLIQAIRVVASGEAWVDQRLIQLLASGYPSHEDPLPLIGGLKGRQQTVVRGVVDGLSNRKIAYRLGVSESTVKSTLQQLFAKVGVRTRSQLVRAALEGALGTAAKAENREPNATLKESS